MWQTEWSTRPPRIHRDNEESHVSAVDSDTIDSVFLHHWSEHCVECAVPDCYQVCSLYVPRHDRKCSRFRHGIYPNPSYQGPFGYGADIYFRRWGKLLSYLKSGSVSRATFLRTERLDRNLLQLINPASRFLQPLSPKRRINGAYAVLRQKAIDFLTRKSTTESTKFDDFLIEVWNPSDQIVPLILECYQGALRFRKSLVLVSGHNLFRIPAAEMNLDFANREGHIVVYPDNDAEVRVIFTWLDFVRYRIDAQESASRAVPSPKVKCVVWDLDNTLWDGILVEDGPEGIKPRVRAVQLIRDLDERGIVQSIASKNDYDFAWNLLRRLGVADYFLYPAIHWNPKSDSIRLIAEELNIGLDTMAIIDDSPFERAEVARVHPQVRVYSDQQLDSLLTLPELDAPVTAQSKLRRKSYLVEATRRHIAKSHGDDYESFLEDCRLQATLFPVEEIEDAKRCLELVQRSNQLNLSTQRYDEEEFQTLLSDPRYLCIATSSGDRFGDYGIVGFASILVAEEVPRLKDFVMSCRVFQKKIELSWFRWLAIYLSKSGFTRLHAAFIPTARNAPLRDVLHDVGFVELQHNSDTTPRISGEIVMPESTRHLELDFAAVSQASQIVTINSKSFSVLPKSHPKKYSLQSRQ